MSRPQASAESTADEPRGPQLRLASSVLLAMGLWFSASAVVPQLATHWMIDGSRLGWLTASVQLGFVAGALVSALLGLADRLALRGLIGLSALLAALSNGAIVIPGMPFEAALILRAGTGFCLAGVYPPAMKLVASWTRLRRGYWTGVLIGALTLGASLPHLLNASLATAAVGSQDSAGLLALPPWPAIVLGGSVLACLGAALAFTLRTGPYASPPSRKRQFHWREVPALLGNRSVRLANIGYLGHMWELYAMWTWLPVYLGMAFLHAGLPHGAARWTAFLAIAAGAPGCVIGGWLADRIGRTTTTALAMIASGSAAIGAALAFNEPLLLALICVVWGFTVIADSAQFSAAVSELSPPERMGTALTLQTALGFALTIVSIQLVPIAASFVGWPLAMALLAAGPAVGAIAMLWLRRLPEATAMAGGRR